MENREWGMEKRAVNCDQLSGVEGGFPYGMLRDDGEAAALEDTFASLSTGVGVNHGGFDVFVAEQFLDGVRVACRSRFGGGGWRRNT